jgi:ATP-dependent Lhr-like helicase
MGRTGRRAGQVANTTFFCETTEGVLQAIALVELAKSGWVEPVEVDGRCWPVLIHQLLAMSLAGDGITAEDAWAHLSLVPDFREIERDEYERLLSWMLDDGALRMASGRLVFGPKAERRFGRRNFMELFAVFESPESYTVQTLSGQPLGSLNQAFVDRLVEDVSCFLLGGRPWVVSQVQHEDRRVLVAPAPRGRQPTWGGYLPQFLGREVCQQILRTLTEDGSYPYLEDSAAGVLAEQRARLGPLLDAGNGGVEVTEDEVRWWTFAGGRINATLRYALEIVGGDCQVIPDNFLVKVRAEDLDRSRFDDLVLQIREPDFWHDSRLWARVTGSLPGYRLSKFQSLMPPWVEREVLSRHLLDVRGAWEWLSDGSHQSETRVHLGRA